MLANADAVRRIKNVQVVLLDEVSMIAAETIDMLDELFRRIRDDPRDFGGVQFIFVGDPCQLEPISKNNAEKASGAPMFFEAAAFQRAVPMENRIFLAKSYRQDGDHAFRDICDKLRYGEDAEAVVKAFNVNPIEKDPGGKVWLNAPVGSVTHIFSDNNEVFAYTRKELARLNKEELLESPMVIDALMKTALGNKAQEVVLLKRGVQAIITKNMPKLDLFNGQRVRVKDFTKLDTGRYTVTVNVASEVPDKDGNVPAEQLVTLGDEDFNDNSNISAVSKVMQLPLMYAHCLTVHRVQGQQFDKLWVHADRLFARQQAYVAVTRGKTFDSVYVTNLALHAVKNVNEAAIGWVKAIIDNQGNTPDVPLSVEELMPTTTCFALSLIEPRLAAVYRRIMHRRNPQWRGLFGNTGGGGDAERAAGAEAAAVAGGAALDIDAGEAAGAEEAEDAVAAAEAVLQEAEAADEAAAEAGAEAEEEEADAAAITGRKRGHADAEDSTAGAGAGAGMAEDGADEGASTTPAAKRGRTETDADADAEEAADNGADADAEALQPKPARNLGGRPWRKRKAGPGRGRKGPMEE